MRSYAVVALFVSLTAYGMAHRAQVAPQAGTPPPTPEGSPLVAPSPMAEPSPRPTLGQVPKIITLTCDGSCNAKERGQLPLVEHAMNQTLSGDCFVSYFMTPGRRIDMANGLTPKQILAKLWEPTTLTLNMYYNGHTKAEGYEQSPDYSTIHMNRAYTASWGLCEIASLGLHEFTHTKQFYHTGNRAAPNYYTVPYQVNNATEGNDDMPACCIEPKLY